MTSSTPINADWICPDLRPFWTIARLRDSEEIVLKAIEGNAHFVFSPIEGYALRLFSGQYSIAQIQTACEQQFPDCDRDFLLIFLNKLIDLEIIGDRGTQRNNQTHHPNSDPPPNPLPRRGDRTEISPSFPSFQREVRGDNHQQITNNPYQLKSTVEWIAHPDGYWILRNTEDSNYQMQVSDRDKIVLEQLSQQPIEIILSEFCMTRQELQGLLQMLSATGMLVGSEIPQPKKAKKFHPLQLLYFRVRLFDPDMWLSQIIPKISFLWTSGSAFLLSVFLSWSAIVGVNQSQEIIAKTQALFLHQGRGLWLPFVLLMAFIVTLHEFGHASTLKYYGGKVPDVGLLFMCLIPAAYTNSTDSYFLSRKQRILVVGAGILVQLIIAALSLWLWHLTRSGNWLNSASLLLLSAALATIAVNLNPLAKFDGYYLAVATTGINNLRSRAFEFYGNLLTGKPTRENRKDAFILAIYAPFSLFYIWCVFGFLIWRLTTWTLANIPLTATFLLTIWLIYYYAPNPKENRKSP